MPIQILDESCYRGGAANSIITDGISADTHIAFLDLNEGKSLTKCYVKIYPPYLIHNGKACHNMRHKGLENEIVGHLISYYAEMNVPDAAGIIIGPLKMFSQKPSWADFFDIDDDSLVAAWWTKDMSSPSLKAICNIDGKNVSRKQFSMLSENIKKMKKTGVIYNIISIDDLMSNIDRNIGNILLEGENNPVLIDHGQCLTSDHWNWDNLDPNQDCRNKMKELYDICNADHHREEDSGRMLMAYDNVAEKINSKILYLSNWVEKILEPKDAEAVIKFFKERVKSKRLAGSLERLL